jgi:hypothetical protein
MTFAAQRPVVTTLALVIALALSAPTLTTQLLPPAGTVSSGPVVVAAASPIVLM